MSKELSTLVWKNYKILGFDSEKNKNKEGYGQCEQNHEEHG